MLVFVLNKCFINSSLFYLFLIKCLWVRCHFMKQCPRNAPAQLALQGFQKTNKPNKQTPRQTSIVWIINDVLPSDENYPHCQIYSRDFFSRGIWSFNRFIFHGSCPASSWQRKKERKKNTKKKWVCGSQQPSEPNLQAALVTQRRRTCSDALRPERGKNSLPGDATSVSGCF